MNTKIVPTKAPEISEEIKSDPSLMDVNSARAVAQIQGAMAIAKRFPRDENAALNRITNAAKRRRVAEQAEYEYSKGGSSVSGASIRAVEVISQAWGNMISGITEVKRDPETKESVMLAYAADLETNNWKFIEWSVPHTTDTRAGAKNLSSGRDIYERVMNDGSRRLRNCLLAVIPSDVTDHFLDECNKTLNQDDVPLVTRLSQMCDAMKGIGITQPMIENKMGCAFGSLTERQLAQLRRIYQAIKDGFGKPNDYFKEALNQDATERFKENIAPPKSAAVNQDPGQPSYDEVKQADNFDDFNQTHFASLPKDPKK